MLVFQAAAKEGCGPQAGQDLCGAQLSSVSS